MPNFIFKFNQKASPLSHLFFFPYLPSLMQSDIIATNVHFFSFFSCQTSNCYCAFSKTTHDLLHYRAVIDTACPILLTSYRRLEHKHSHAERRLADIDSRWTRPIGLSPVIYKFSDSPIVVRARFQGFRPPKLDFGVHLA